MKRFSLPIRKHYSTKYVDNKPTLVCDTCAQSFQTTTLVNELMAHTQSHQTPQGEKLYTVAQVGEEVTAQRTPYMHPDRVVDAVYTVPGGHVIHLYAANQKHAEVKFAGLSKAHFNPGAPGTGRRHWRFNLR